jgi:hypothetical protein
MVLFLFGFDYRLYIYIYTEFNCMILYADIILETVHFERFHTFF